MMHGQKNIKLYYLGLSKYTFAQRRISQNVSPSLSDACLNKSLTIAKEV
jgi:hypothetical protein